MLNYCISIYYMLSKLHPTILKIHVSSNEKKKMEKRVSEHKKFNKEKSIQ